MYSSTKQKKNIEKYGWNKQRMDCLNYIFNEVFKFTSNKNKEYIFTPVDIDYDDNDPYVPNRISYIEFHLKELPMWKFGIWFDDPVYDTVKKMYPNHFKGVIFAQVERFIDKFKPSRSPFHEDFSYYPEHVVEFEDGPELIKTELPGDFSIQKMLQFMYDQPALAFCRDYYGIDYNTEYMSKAEATRRMNKVIAKQDERDANKKIMSGRVVDFFLELATNREKYFKEYLVDAIVTEYRDNTIPSRNFYLYWPEGEDEHDYSFIPKDDMTKEGYDLWKSWIKETKKLGKKLKVYFWEFDTIDIYCTTLVSSKKRWKWLKKSDISKRV